jgi:hypothetical protein
LCSHGCVAVGHLCAPFSTATLKLAGASLAEEVIADMSSPAKVANLADLLKSAGLRPTRQRVALGGLLFTGQDRHVSAEALHEEAQIAGCDVSLATVYNTLHQFTQAGLLRSSPSTVRKCISTRIHPITIISILPAKGASKTSTARPFASRGFRPRQTVTRSPTSM